MVDRLRADAAAALKAGDKPRVSALRLLSSEVERAGKDGRGDDTAVLQRERKRRLEAATAYRDADREDLAGAEEREAAIIEEYLPQQLSDAELDTIVGDAVAESGAASQKEMGRIMSVVMPRVEGRADGKRVSAAVREKLTA